jgi:hypothetical protein
MDPIIGKNYSIKDLKDLYGEDYLKYVPGITLMPWEELNEYLSSKNIIKKPILQFEDFDDETKNIYTQIKQIVLSKNPNQDNISVWATGSRIYGTWRTKEEEDIICRYNNKKPKYSDYDYCTDARNRPLSNVFMEIIGVKVDFSDCGSDKKVLIP